MTTPIVAFNNGAYTASLCNPDLMDPIPAADQIIWDFRPGNFNTAPITPDYTPSLFNYGSSGGCNRYDSMFDSQWDDYNRFLQEEETKKAEEEQKAKEQAELDAKKVVDPMTGREVSTEKVEKVQENLLSKAKQKEYDELTQKVLKIAQATKKKGAMDVAGQHLGGVAAGAAAGAAIGTWIPVPIIGTVSGAIIGGIIGGVSNAIYSGSRNDDLRELSEEVRNSLEGLEGEDLVAFQEYFRQSTGSELSDVLIQTEYKDDGFIASLDSKGKAAALKNADGTSAVDDILENMDEAQAYMEEIPEDEKQTTDTVETVETDNTEETKPFGQNVSPTTVLAYIDSLDEDKYNKSAILNLVAANPNITLDELKKELEESSFYRK